AGVEGRLTTQDKRLNDIGVRIDKLGTDEVGARAQLQQALIAEMDRRDTANRQALDARFTQADAASQQRLDTVLAKARTGWLQDVHLRATHAGTSAANTVANQLRGEMHTVAQDEVAGARDALRQLVAEHVQAATASVPQPAASQ